MSKDNVNEIYLDFRNLDKLVNKKFLPLFTDLNHRTYAIMGGASSGKSYSMAQLVVFRCLYYQDQKWLVLRKAAANLEVSVIAQIKKIITEWNLWSLFEYKKKDRKIICQHANSEILFAGVDDPEKIKSIEGITSIWMEEATNFDLRDYRQLQLRMRGQMKWAEGRHQLFATYNPVARDNFVYELFHGDNNEVDDDTLVMHSTYRDNAFIDEQTIKEMEKLRKTDYEHYLVYALGSFADKSDTTRFYRSFDPSVHVGTAYYNPMLPLHISTDWNRLPGICSVVLQVSGNEIRQIKEVTRKHQTTEAQAKELLELYSDHRAGLFLYGDANAKQRQTQSKLTDLGIMQRVLEPLDPVSRFTPSNPPVATSGQFVNRIMAEVEGDLTFKIDDRCETSIKDYLECKLNPDGTMLKKKGRYQGQVVELVGHESDALRYALTGLFPSRFTKYQRGPAAGKIGSVRRKRGRFNY